MWTIFKVFIEFFFFFYNIASVLCVAFLAARHGGILDPQPGTEPVPPALEGKILTTGPPGKVSIFKSILFFFFFRQKRKQTLTGPFSECLQSE